MTGATGFLGRYMLEGLCRHGMETVVLGRRRTAGTSSANFIEADLLATPDLAALVKESGDSRRPKISPTYQID